MSLLLLEPQEAITRNVTNIVNFIPRTRASAVSVTEFEKGLQIPVYSNLSMYNTP